MDCFSYQPAYFQEGNLRVPIRPLNWRKVTCVWIMLFKQEVLFNITFQGIDFTLRYNKNLASAPILKPRCKDSVFFFIGRYPIFVLTTVSGRGSMVLGDSQGSVWLVNRHWEVGSYSRKICLFFFTQSFDWSISLWACGGNTALGLIRCSLSVQSDFQAWTNCSFGQYWFTLFWLVDWVTFIYDSK